MEYTDELKGMGYAKEWRYNVLQASITGYSRILKIVRLGERLRNRTGPCTVTKRRFNRLVERSEWHRAQQEDEEDGVIGESWIPWDQTQKRKKGTKQDHRYTESIMYIPHTPDSQMKKRLQEMEKNLGYRTR